MHAQHTLWLSLGAGLLLLTSTLGCQGEHPSLSQTQDHNPDAAPSYEGATAPPSPMLAPTRVSPDPGGWLYLVELDRAALGLTPAPEDTQARARWSEVRHKALRDGKRALLRELGLDPGALRYAYPALPVAGLWLNKAQLQQVERHPWVVSAQPNQVAALHTSSSLGYLGISSSGGVNSDSSAGQGTVVAVIDSAVQYWRPEFGGCGSQGSPQLNQGGCAIARLDNFMDCSLVPFQYPGYHCVTGAQDFDGVAAATNHGTNVSGVIHNVAPGASLWSLNATHVLYNDDNPDQQVTVLFDADIVDGLNAVYAQPQGVVAVNLSLGTARPEGSNSFCTSPLRAALRSLWEDHGIIAVAATGNDGLKNAVASPACDPYTVAVGAHYDSQGDGAQATFGVNGATCSETVRSGQVTCFSNSQTMVDLVAPGALITAGGFQLTGTSQATPHVTALAAIHQSQASRDLEAWERVARLRASSQELIETAQGQDNQSYTYFHRRLTTNSALAPQRFYELHHSPDGQLINAGQTATFSVNTQAVASREGDPGGQAITDLWLDAQVSASDASNLRLTLTAPSGAQRTLEGSAGVHLNELFGDQADAGLRHSMDGEALSGTWSLSVQNLGSSAARVYRATLMVNTEAVTVQPPSSFGAFSFDRAQVSNDGVEVQTLRLTLRDAANVDDVRFLINYPSHVENGRDPGGYFQVTPATCGELTTGLGNADVEVITEGCERNTALDGSTEYVLRFVAEPSFSPADNNTVSAIWYEGGTPITSWRKVTQTGAGFDVVGAAPDEPSSFGSFSFDQAQVSNDGVQLQTLRLTLRDAANVDDVRFFLNYPSHVENGRGASGYFQVTPGECKELTGGQGNADVEIVTEGCERNTALDGSTEYVLRFAVEPSFAPVDNNQVSVIWYEGGVQRTGWRKVTQAGAGFDVVGTTPDEPSSFGNFSFDQAQVSNDGVQLQTLRLTLNSAANVDDVRFFLNYPSHVENGRGASGYFQVTPGECKELTGGLGNADVEIVTEGCERNTALDGSTEYVLRFSVEPGFAPVDNNQVSVIWYEGGVQRTGWRKVTQAGAGFDVVGTTPDEPSTFQAFSMDRAQVSNDGVQVQTLRLTLNSAANVDDVRFFINYPAHDENSAGYGGYFQVTPTDCLEVTSGLGNDRVGLLTQTCQRNTSDGATEYVVQFTVSPNFPVSDDNTVSAIWYEGGVQRTGWRKVTQEGAGFSVVAP